MPMESPSLEPLPATSYPTIPTKLHLIAGPCSAESEEQVISMALFLKSVGIHRMRAGVWKPRTRPGTFAGHGIQALPWLAAARKQTGMGLAIEVANAAHVEAALSYDIDFLWIGARTSVNPFAVQEIADALAGVPVMVMVKNPINPDRELWAGAIERILKAAPAAVWACHRGFNVPQKSAYRNPPLWEIPLELKRLFPDIPLICDPSHISGNATLVREISQRALDLGMEGLMVEVHADPATALSDRLQQLSPTGFAELLDALQYRNKSTENPGYHSQLALLRERLDQIDQVLIELLADRMDLARQIGALKKAHSLPYYEHRRWDEVLKTALAQAARRDLSPELTEKLFTLVHLASIEAQNDA